MQGGALHVGVPGPHAGLGGAERLQSDGRANPGAGWVPGAARATHRSPARGHGGAARQMAAPKNQRSSCSVTVGCARLEIATLWSSMAVLADAFILFVLNVCIACCVAAS